MVEVRVILYDKNVTNRLLLKSRLHDLSLEGGKSLESHLDEFFSIIMDLQKIDVEIDDEDMARLSCCCCVLCRFRIITFDILLYGRDDLSLQDVKDALTQRYLIDNKFVNKSNNPSQPNALVANGGKNFGKNKICNYCHVETQNWEENHEYALESMNVQERLQKRSKNYLSSFLSLICE